MFKKIISILLAIVIIFPTFSTYANAMEIDSNFADNGKLIPSDAVYYSGNYYKIYNLGGTWEEAKTYCESLGGHLATITSDEENTFLYNYMKSKGYSNCYFGLKRNNEAINKWEWVTGESFDYINWASGEPNNENNKECYGMFFLKYKSAWNDGDGYASINDCVFMCEWDSLSLEFTKSEIEININSETRACLNFKSNDIKPEDITYKVSDENLITIGKADYINGTFDASDKLIMLPIKSGANVGDCTIEAVAPDGKTCSINIKVVSKTEEENMIDSLDLDSMFDDASFEGGSINAPTVEIFDKPVNVFELSSKFSLPKNIKVSYVVDTSEKKIQVLIGWEKDITGSSDENSKKQIKDAIKEVKTLYKNEDNAKLQNDLLNLRSKLQKQNFKCFNANLNLIVTGYMEWSYEDGVFKPNFNEGGMIIGARGVNDYKQRWISMPVVYTKLGIKAEIGGKFKFLPTLPARPDLTIFFYPELYGGLGVGGDEKTVCLEGTVNANLNMEWDVPKDLSAKFTGSIKASGYALDHRFFSIKKTFADVTLYDSKQNTNYARMLSNSNNTYKVAKLTDEELNNVKPIPREYLKNQTNLAKRSRLATSTTSFTKTSIYPYSSPNFISIGNGKNMLIWTDDDGTKSDKNRTSLMYSIYDGNSWSEANKIAETGTYNKAAKTYVNDGKIYVLWSKANKVWDDNISFKDMVESMELYYSVYENGEFKEPVLVNEDGNTFFETNYDIAVSNGKVGIVWQENTASDIFLEEGENKLYFREFDGNNASDKTLIETSNIAFDEVCCGYENGELVVAYTKMDEGSNSMSDEITDVYLYSSGKSSKITNSNLNNSQVQIVDGNLYYLEGTSLKKYDISSATTSNEGIENINNYEILTNGNKKAIVSINAEKNSFDLIASYYDNESAKWSNFVDVTDYNKYIRSYSVILNDNNEITGAINMAEIVEDGDENSELFGTSTLVVTDLDKFSNLSIANLHYDYDKVMPSSDLELNFEATNNSRKQISNLNVSVLDANNNVLQESSLECNIGVGETQNLTYVYKLPEIISFGEIKLKVTSGDNETNLDDNVITFTVGYTDIELDYVEATQRDGKYKALGILKNTSSVDAKNVKVLVYNTNKEGDLIETLDIGDIEAGGSKSLNFDIPEDYLSEYSLLYFDVTSDIQDAKLGNNSYLLVLNAKDYLPSVQVKFDSDNGNDIIKKNIKQGDVLDYTPEIPTKDGYVFVGWFKDVDDIATEYKSGSTYTEDVTYTAKYAHINMLGAQVKAVVDNKSGIRFGTRIYNDGDEIIEKGTLILPAKLLADGEALTLETPKVAISVGDENYEVNKEKNYVTYLGTIVNIPESQFDTNMTASSYVIYKDKAGNEYTVYSPYKKGSTTINKLLGVVK